MEDKQKIMCTHCRKEIESGQRRHQSKQAGMKGFYHWDCFISACRQANKAGAQEIESIAVGDSGFDTFGLGYEIIEE